MPPPPTAVVTPPRSPRVAAPPRGDATDPIARVHAARASCSHAYQCQLSRRRCQMAPTLEDAILLAVQAHRGQQDKVGQPYILHPLRVLARVRGEAAQTAAILHDVVED